MTSRLTELRSIAVDSAKTVALVGPNEKSQRTMRKAAGCNVESKHSAVLILSACEALISAFSCSPSFSSNCVLIVFLHSV
ncbi:hypothetical protein [Clostridium sp.]|uniref:hypothetical protein n=1 Tax=Clostridium sp. TaxID=1506 RepID=UPI002588311F|nr:hypothetical protein [Clostridium sp.]